MNATIELAARLVGQNFVRLQHGDDADAWQYTMSAHDVVSAFSQFRYAEIERLRAALLDCARRCEALKRPCGMDPESAQAVRNGEYMSIALVARAALGPNVGVKAAGTPVGP